MYNLGNWSYFPTISCGPASMGKKKENKGFYFLKIYFLGNGIYLFVLLGNWSNLLVVFVVAEKA